LNNAKQRRIETAKQETAKRHATTEAFAAKNIKGWDANLHRQIVTWASENGFSDDRLKEAYTPEVYLVPHKACQWDQSLKRQQSVAPLPKTQAQTAAKPTQTVSAKSSVAPSFDPESASTDDYAKNWAARQAKRR